MKHFVLITLFFTTLSVQTARQQKHIVVYGSDTCHYCIDTKTYLKAQKIAFTYFDIDKNKAKEQEMLVKLKKAKIDVSNLNLPVIDKGGEIFTNEKDFEKFLERIKENSN